MTIDEFQKADLRVGMVVGAERVEGSEKLLKLLIDIGEVADGVSVPRHILSGIAKKYGSEDLLGKKVVIIANLDPRMMMGMESNGMLLAAHNAAGAPVVIMPAEEVPIGAKIM